MKNKMFDTEEEEQKEKDEQEEEEEKKLRREGGRRRITRRQLTECRYFLTKIRAISSGVRTRKVKYCTLEGRTIVSYILVIINDSVSCRLAGPAHVNSGRAVCSQGGRLRLTGRNQSLNVHDSWVNKDCGSLRFPASLFQSNL